MTVLDPDEMLTLMKFEAFSDFFNELARNHSLRAKEEPAFSKLQFHNNRLASLFNEVSNEYAILSGLHKDMAKKGGE